MIDHMASSGLSTIEAERKSEEEWRQTVITIGNSSLLPTTKSVSLDTSLLHTRHLVLLNAYLYISWMHNIDQMLIYLIVVHG